MSSDVDTTAMPRRSSAAASVDVGAGRRGEHGDVGAARRRIAGVAAPPPRDCATASARSRAPVVDEDLDAVGARQLAGRPGADGAGADHEDASSPGQRRSVPVSSRQPPVSGGVPPVPRSAEDGGDEAGEPEGDESTADERSSEWG